MHATTRPTAHNSHKSHNLPPLRSHGRALPPKIKQLVERCWAADFEERPEFIEVIKQLEAVLKELPPDRKPAGGGGDGGGCVVM